MNAMLAGHFLHTPIAPLKPNAPKAKVIYPREGGWLYVLVGPSSESLDVVAFSGNRRITIASLAPGTETRATFVPTAQRITTVQLLKNGTPIAIARIDY